MMLVINHPGAPRWVQRLIPKVQGWMGEPKSIAALDENGFLLGAVVYDSFTPYDCCLHIALADKRCVTRRNIRAVFAYPFEQLHLARVTAQIAPSNARSLVLARHLGFLHEGTKRKGLGDESELIFGLTREECRRWL